MKHLSIVRSSAGSGKTYLLAVEYVCRVVVEPQSYRSILAVTFTNKATGEMKRRIIEELFGLARGVGSSFFDDVVSRSSLSAGVVRSNAAIALRLILNDYSLFAVSTIDKFFQRIVRSFFYELGLDVNYAIEVDSGLALEQAVDATIEAASGDDVLARVLLRLTDEVLDKGLSANIRSRLISIAGQIFSNIDTCGKSIDEQTAIYDNLRTDYNAGVKALKDLCCQASEFIGQAGLSPYDFKYKESSFLNYFFKIERSGAIEAYGKRFEAVAAGEECFYDSKSEKYNIIEDVWSNILDFTVRVKDLYDELEFKMISYEALSRNFSCSLLLQSVGANFLSILSSQGKLPISRTAELIDKVSKMADVPFIFENLGTRYNTIYIDEFQDTSRDQWDGFVPLIEEVVSQSSSPSSVMLIGDIKQAIYRWRGGDWNILARDAGSVFAPFLDDGRVLSINWRSEYNIVSFNNWMMAGVVERADNYLGSILECGGDFGSRLSSLLSSAYLDVNQTVSPPKSQSKQGYVSVNTSAEPLVWLVDKVEQILSRGCAPGDIAILTRRKEEGRQVAQALAMEGIAVVSDESLLINSSDTVCFIVNVLRMVAGVAGDIELAVYNRYLGRDFREKLADGELDLIDRLQFCTVLDSANSAIRFYNLQHLDVAYVQALCNEIYIYNRDNGGGVSAFIDAWDSKLSGKGLTMSENSLSAVRILTIHKSKGLEFKSVLIPFCNWSLLPSASTTMWVNCNIEPYSLLNPILLNYTASLEKSVFSDAFYVETSNAIIDNINLLYVALTRAREELYVCLPVEPATVKSPTVATMVHGVLGGDTFENGVVVDLDLGLKKDDFFIERYESFSKRINFSFGGTDV